MSDDETVDVGLGAWTPPAQYQDLQLERQGSKEPADISGPVNTLELLHFGEEAEMFTLRGEGYAKDVSVLQNYKGKALTLRHTAYSGKMYIESVRASSTERTDELTDLRMHNGEMQEVTEEKQVYTYRVGLVKVEEMDEE
jgi:hypothetical protein